MTRRITIGLLLTFIVCIVALMIIPPSGAEPGYAPRGLHQALEHCDRVWVEHKLKPAGGVELLADDCHQP